MSARGCCGRVSSNITVDTGKVVSNALQTIRKKYVPQKPFSEFFYKMTLHSTRDLRKEKKTKDKTPFKTHIRTGGGGREKKNAKMAAVVSIA